jgi:rsbT co-antagonist protein RsbR
VNVSEEVADRIAGMLLVLSDVTEGIYEERLECDLPNEHPLGALTVGINEMTRALAAAQRDSVRYQQELEEKLALIERQKLAMRELATPIIDVWEGVLCLPVVGVVDTGRSTEMTDALLQAVVAKSAECVIVDITGIDVLDTRTSEHFLRMARAVRLLGSRCMLTGVNPIIAQTMVRMGVELQEIECYRNLRDALKRWVQASGTESTKIEKSQGYAASTSRYARVRDERPDHAH